MSLADLLAKDGLLACLNATNIPPLGEGIQVETGFC